MTGDGEHTGPGGQLGADHLDEGSEPEALRLHGVDALGLQGQGGDRSDARREDVVAQCVQHLGEYAAASARFR